MLVVKTIILLCLTKYNYNVANPANFQNMDSTISKCVDNVSACYHTQNKDIFKCLDSYVKKQQVD
jgi:hypothetical protein